MKNNKYAPYILAPILILVWGIIFYKIYQAVYGGKNMDISTPFQILPIYENVLKDNSFSLLLDYKDPFLGKSFVSEPSNSNFSKNSLTPKTNQIINKTPSKPVITPSLPSLIKPFPTIAYQGFQIMEQDTIALIKIDGRFYPTARVGEIYKGVELLKIYMDSILLLFDGQQQTFIKVKK